MTDTDALKRYARQRDPDAFAHLVENYQQMVYAVCLRRLGHEADARDATQDTFVKLAKSAGDIRDASGGGSLVGWLHRCATTTSLDLIRKASRRRTREDKAVEMAELVTPAIDHEWAEVRAALDETLDELPEDQRDLIVQRYLVGRKQNELAAELGVSESMTSRRVKAAVEDLRQRLHAKGFGVGLAALTTGLAAESTIALPVGLSAGLASVGVAGVAGAAGFSGAGVTVLAGGVVGVLVLVAVSVMLYLAASRSPGDDVRPVKVVTAGVAIDGRILRPAATDGGSSTSSSSGPSGYIKLQGHTVRSIFEEAYGLPGEPYVIFDGVEPTQRYDAEINGEDWKRVLGDVLRYELGWVGTRERRVLPAYVLRVPEGGRHTLSPVPDDQQGGSMSSNENGVLFRKASVRWLRLNLENWLDTAVLDETGIEGEFNYHFDAGPNPGFAEYAAAVRDDLGLELVEVPGGREFDVVVVRTETNPAQAIFVAGDIVNTRAIPVGPTDPPRFLRDLIQAVDTLPDTPREDMRVLVFRPVPPSRTRNLFGGTIGQIEAGLDQSVELQAGDRVTVVKP